ncbi:MAG: hypothetical protein ACXACU_03930, partial [Candidatus Hodarchaeales archaeon]
MIKKEALDSSSINQESLPNVIKTKGGFTIIVFFTIFSSALVLGFVVLRLILAQALGEIIIIVDLGSVIVLIIGAITLTYFYYTRYIKREIVFTDSTLALKVGKRVFEYKWNEFSVVALSLAIATSGIKGFTIRLYNTDLEGDYVELPIYRFPKSVDVFTIRNLVETKVKK